MAPHKLAWLGCCPVSYSSRELYSNSMTLLRAEDVFSRLFTGIYGVLLSCILITLLLPGKRSSVVQIPYVSENVLVKEIKYSFSTSTAGVRYLIGFFDLEKE